MGNLRLRKHLQGIALILLCGLSIELTAQDLYNKGLLVIAPGGSLTASNVTNASGANLTDHGTLNVSGAFRNYGYWYPSNGTVVFNGTSVQPLDYASSDHFYHVEVRNLSGISLTRDINIHGNLYTAGTILHNNKEIHFEGSSLQRLQGDNTIPLDVYTIDINNGGAGLLLERDVNIADDLEMSHGDLDLAEYTVDLGTTGKVEYENNSNRIKGSPGKITATDYFSSGNYYANIAGTGLNVQPNNTLGWTKVERTHHDQGGDLERQFRLLPSTAGSTWMNVTYLDNEIKGPESNWDQFLSVGGGPYSNIGGTHYASSNHILSQAYIGKDGMTTASSGANPPSSAPLPVELLNFTVHQEGRTAVLLWSTASEVNNNYFAVERSRDGETFEEIAKVDGAGFSNNVRSYRFIDHEPYNKDNYYRLRQVDFDGTNDVSPMRYLWMEPGNQTASAFPNPVSGQQVSVSGWADGETLTEIQLVNSQGMVVHRQPFLREQTTLAETFTLEPRPQAGMYLLQIATTTNTYQTKLIVR